MRPDATEIKHSPARRSSRGVDLFLCPGGVREPQITHNMTIHKNKHASVRIWATNPDHHLYNNNGTWWVHYTAYKPDHTSKRIRHSLRTRCIEEARERRDALLGELFHEDAKGVAA